jgi:hypothetical protein
VVIKTPAPQQSVSRGFYQVEEDCLYIPIYPGGKFYSFLDSPQAVFDIDNKGRLLFLKVLIPRRNWVIHKSLKAPTAAGSADIRFLGFRNSLPNIILETSRQKSWLRLVFERCDKMSAYAAAENLIFEITPNKELAAVWITNIEDDRGARGMAAWRKKLKEEHSQSNSDSPYIRVEVKRSPP